MSGSIGRLGRRYFCRSLAMALLLTVAGCTTSSMFAGSKAGTATTAPASEQFGSGSVVIGLLAFDEPANLSDGAAGSSYLAGRQAATTLAKSPVTLMIRRYDGKISSIKKLAADFAKAGAKAVIGPDTDDGTAMLAKELSGKGITIISASLSADPSQRTFGAGLSASDEARVAVAEMSNRGYTGVVIATLPGWSGQVYSSLLASAALSAKIDVRLIDFSDPVGGVAKFKESVASGFKPSALAFSTGPEKAKEIGALLRTDPVGSKLPFVGNSGWSFAPPSAAIGGQGWYTTLASNNLADFGKKFVAVNGEEPTLLAAVVYDLVTMAGALPQVVKEDPFQAGVIGNEQGFKGQTGHFMFNDRGVAERAFVVTSLK